MNKVIVTDMSQLPVIENIENLYLDCETTSGDPKLDALNPWKHCSVAGVSFTADDLDTAWYIPVGHAFGRNMPKYRVTEYVRDLMQNSRRYVNHNVKFDMHVLKNDLGVNPPPEVRCTVTSAKTLDSDRIFRGGYGLEALAKGWLNRGDEDGKQKATLAPYLAKNKDYGRIPIDVLGLYACQDAFLARDLDLCIEQRMPEECALVHKIEQQLTLALFDMERHGLRVDPVQLMKTQLLNETRMLMIEQELADLTGMSIRPHVNADCESLLCGKYGLPVLAWTDTEGANGQRRPSFDKEALRGYEIYPGAPRDVVRLMLEYRRVHTLQSLFVIPYQELTGSDGRLHPQYNQAIKTFRMSCGKPNMQQLSAEARGLVLPDPGRAFVSIDMSQEEFRLIVHYIKNPECVAAYLNDPDTDFHDWVARMCSVKRGPAKTTNFCMAYGGGKATVLSSLLSKAFADLVGNLGEVVDGLIADGRVTEDQRAGTLDMLMRRRAEKVYEEYHARLPELKATSRNMSLVFRQRGYVRNAYGRRLAGPPEVSHHAFNKIIQSTAAEILKDRTVALAPRFCERVRANDTHIVASVHDETLFDMPIEAAQDREYLRWLRDEMCATQVKFRVPMRATVAVSKTDWREAAKSKEAEQACAEWLGPYQTESLPVGS